MGCVPLHPSPPAGIPVGTAGKAAMALTAGVVWELLGNAVMPVEGTASLCLASLPAPFLSAVLVRIDTHMLPAGKATAKGQCPHSIQHLQCLPGVIRPLLLWCTHQPPVLSDSGPEGLCCRMPVDAPTDRDQPRPALHLLRSSQQVMCRSLLNGDMYVCIMYVRGLYLSVLLSRMWSGARDGEVGLCFAHTHQCSCFLSRTTPG